MTIGIRTAFVFFASAGAALAQTTATAQGDREAPEALPTVRSLDQSAIDKSADPCTDFYQYACGNWKKNNALPHDQVRWVRSFSLLHQQNLYELWQRLDQAAEKPASPLEKKYGDFFAACMDVVKIDKKGLESLRTELERIAGFNDSKGIATLVGELAAAGDPAPPFRLNVEPDQKDSSKHILTVSEGGLTLRERESYRDPEAQGLRKRYVNHMTRVFMLAGDTIDQGLTEAMAVYTIEAALAQASADREDSSDLEKRYHIYAFADLQKLAPAFDFKVYFKGVTAAPIETVNVANPDFLKGVNGLLASAPIDEWKSYFRWHLLSGQVEALPAAFRDEDFAFWGGYFVHQEKPAPRWKQCAAITDRAFGDAIEQEWVKQNFPPAAKASMERMTAALEKALADEMRTLPWMSNETRKTAERKLAAIRNRIGYPKKWRDYSGLRVDSHDFLGNLHRSAIFERDYLLGKVGKPVDTDEWEITPVTVNASYSPSGNSLFIPAGIIQPPFFDSAADPGVNFGAIGVIAGHELTHGFDDLGSKFDESGNVREWQTTDDHKRFAEAASCQVAQYSKFGAMPEPNQIPILKVDGQHTLAENTADNGGLRIAFRALTDALASQGKTADEKIDGYTESQRFFLSFAQLWCQNQTLYSARHSMEGDPHSPSRARVNGAVQNFEEFGKAFACTKGQSMYPEKSCRVW